MSLLLKIAVGVVIVAALLFAGIWLFFGIVFKLDDIKKKKEAAAWFLQREFSGNVQIYDYTETSGRRQRNVYIHGKNGHSLSYELGKNTERDEFIASSATAFKRQGESRVTFVSKNGVERTFEYPFD
jgi:hypothetical protein